jgi:hydroxyacylglutathione hydrolase
MGIIVYPMILGPDQCYIIRGKSAVMIDGGAPNKIDQFRKKLELLSIKPAEIKLIVITHGHWDHIGSAKEIKELTGAKIAMHQIEKEWLEKSLKAMPPGINTWGHIMGFIIKMFLPFIRIPGTNVDIVIGNEGLPLDGYGIPGKVIYTPGHSNGSVSVLLDTGEAFVGDMAMNGFPLCLKPGLPIFAEDKRKLIQSWKFLLEQGVQKIYPAHGAPFSADLIRSLLRMRAWSGAASGSGD